MANLNYPAYSDISTPISSFEPVHIRTFSGMAFALRAPQPNMIRIEDISHSLSLVNRGEPLF